MKEQTLLGLKNNIDEGDKLWTKMAYPDSVSDDIMVEIFNWISRDILLGIYDYSKLGLSDNTMLVVANYFKLGE